MYMCVYICVWCMCVYIYVCGACVCICMYMCVFLGSMCVSVHMYVHVWVLVLGGISFYFRYMVLQIQSGIWYFMVFEPAKLH